MNPDTAFRWLMIIIIVFLAFFALLDHFAVTAQQLEAFLNSNKGIVTSLGTLLVILLAAILTTHLSNSSAEKRQEADRLLNAELKLSDFRQAWINQLRADFAEVIQLGYSFFEKGNDQQETARKLKLVEARIRMRLNPRSDAEVEREIEKELVALVSACEKVANEAISRSGDKASETKHCQDALNHRENLAKLGSKFLKEEWEVIKKNLNELKGGGGS